MFRKDLGAEIWLLMTGTAAPIGGPLALLHVLSGGVLFPFNRIVDDLHDDELEWAPVSDAVRMDWVPLGHDPRTDPFSTIGWRWAHLSESLHAIADSESCLGPESPPWLEPPPPIKDAVSAVSHLEIGIRRAAHALSRATDDRLDEFVENDFGTHTRRHWVSLLLMEAIHHAAEVGVLRDLYRRRDDINGGSPT